MDFLKHRGVLQHQRALIPAGTHPLRPSTRLAGGITALANDGDFLWVATTQPDTPYGSHYLLLLHKPSSRWVAQFRAGQVQCLAVDDQYLWIGYRSRNQPGWHCLQRIEKRALYEIPQEKWVADTPSDAETAELMRRLDVREKALFHFEGGDYVKASDLLSTIQPATPETLFLQGLCHDRNGINEPEKARSFFQRIVDDHSTDPLAAEARKQIAVLEKQPETATRP